ncbi:MAG TPA: HAMP domain-containing sensor histidine kinase [Mucilaginibacter sp.]|nr:HAMP domain-containing sensor histidine kinase [Mucilaginibacter sp.]
MFIQIDKEEFLKELGKKAWFQTHNIIWTIFFLYPLFSIVDFIYAKDIWMQVFIGRLIIILLLYILYNYLHTRNYNYRILMHVAFFSLSGLSALLCTLVNAQALFIYFTEFSIVILFFNLQVFWEPVHSLIETLIAVLLLAIFFDLFCDYSIDIFVTNGAQYFFTIALISCLVPNTRHKVIQREVHQQIQIEKSNEQLKKQNHDISEKNHIIDMQYERLRKLDEQKNSFINIAGHDLKNLIGSIIMSNNMLKDEEDRLSSDQKEFVGYIGQSAEKMQYMLSKLMDVKEIESPEMKFTMEVFDINAEVQHVYRGLIETAQMKNIHLVDNILKLPLYVKLDKVFTGQIFQNLLSNIIKFSQTNNSIKVVTSLQRQHFVFEIVDEGIAIGQDELDMMFNKLKTLNEASGHIESRLGLGLSIAKLMTQEMGGELSYRSDENGNYFRVEFNVIN